MDATVGERANGRAVVAGASGDCGGSAVDVWMGGGLWVVVVGLDATSGAKLERLVRTRWDLEVASSGAGPGALLVGSHRGHRHGIPFRCAQLASSGQ